MRDYVLLTDSCCDFSAGMVEQLELCVLPLSFVMEGKEYFNYPDNRDIDPHVFYDKLRGGKTSSALAFPPVSPPPISPPASPPRT